MTHNKTQDRAKGMGDKLSLDAFKSLRHRLKDGFGEAVLVAPNKRIQKIWQKEYPGYAVLLSQKLPTKLTNKESKR